MPSKAFFYIFRFTGECENFQNLCGLLRENEKILSTFPATFRYSHNDADDFIRFKIEYCQSALERSFLVYYTYLCWIVFLLRQSEQMIIVENFQKKNNDKK